MKVRDVPQTGSLGETVSYQNRFGLVRRRKIIPRDPCTPAQVERRLTFQRVRAFWGTITDEQRLAWNTVASRRRTQSVLGRSGPISGYLLCVAINTNLAAIGLPLTADPAPPPTFPSNPVGPLTATRTGGTVSLQLEVSGSPAPYIIVLGAKPKGPGISYVDHYTILGVLPMPQGGFSDITSLYVAKYGVPRVGQRIFIQTIQQINGWRNIPKPTRALVQTL